MEENEILKLKLALEYAIKLIESINTPFSRKIDTTLLKEALNCEKECICYKSHTTSPISCGCPCHDGTKDDVQHAGKYSEPLKEIKPTDQERAKDILKVLKEIKLSETSQACSCGSGKLCIVHTSSNKEFSGYIKEDESLKFDNTPEGHSAQYEKMNKPSDSCEHTFDKEWQCSRCGVYSSIDPTHECKCFYEGEPHAIDFINSPSGKQWAIGGTDTKDRWKFCPWCGGFISNEKCVTKPSDSGGEKEVDKNLFDEINHWSGNEEGGMTIEGFNCLLKILERYGYCKHPKSNELVALDKTLLEREAKSYCDQWYKDNEEHDEKLGSILGFIWERILLKFGQPKARGLSVEEIYCALCIECGNNERGDLLINKAKEQELQRYAKAIHAELLKENAC